MAEIVGASASTIALIETSAKILSHLCGYISKVKNADKRWQKLTDEVEATRQLVDQLQIDPNNERLDIRDDERYPTSQDSALERCLNDVDLVGQLLQDYKRNVKLRRFSWPISEERASRALESVRTIRDLAANLQNLKNTKAIRGILENREKTQEETELLEWLCRVEGVDTEHTYLDAMSKRYKGSGNWLVKSEKYLCWLRDQDKSSHLWLAGPMGCGKTYLMTKVLENVREYECFRGTPVISYWFDYKNSQQTPVNSFLESVIRQLVAQDDTKKSMALIKKLKILTGHGYPLPNEKWKLVANMMSSFEQVYFLIDGFNECDNANELFQYIKDHFLSLNHGLSIPKIKMVITSPLDSRTVAYAVKSIGKFQIVEVNKCNSEDMKQFIYGGISTLSSISGNSVAINKWSTDIMDRSHGSFVYAAKTIPILRKCRTLKALHRRVKSLPNDINGLYDTIFERILKTCTCDADLEEVKRVCRWMCEGNHCLPLPTFRAIMEWSPGDKKVDSTPLATIEEHITYTEEFCDLFQGLLLIDRNLDMPELAFAHPSSELFLLSDDCKKGKSNELRIDRRKAHQLLTEECMDYLTIDAFREAISTPGLATNNPFKKLLGGTSFQPSPRNELEQRLSERFASYPALAYMAHNVFVHFKRGEYAKEDFTKELETNLSWFLHNDSAGKNHTHYRSWQEAHALFCNNPLCECGNWQPPIYFAIQYGLDELVKWLYSKYNYPPNMSFEGGQTPITLALAHKRLTTAKWILSSQNGLSQDVGEDDHLQGLINMCEDFSVEELRAEELKLEGVMIDELEDRKCLNRRRDHHTNKPEFLYEA